jgi:uncharacterized protein
MRWTAVACFCLGTICASHAAEPPARYGGPVIDSYKPWDVSQPGKFLLLASQNPGARFILAHLGGLQFRDMLAFDILRKLNPGNSNVWFDVSFTAGLLADSPLEAELVWVMRKLGMDRMLFGSGWPVDTPAAARQAIDKLGLSQAEQKMLLHDNAKQSLGS